MTGPPRGVGLQRVEGGGLRPRSVAPVSIRSSAISGGQAGRTDQRADFGATGALRLCRPAFVSMVFGFIADSLLCAAGRPGPQDLRSG